MSVGPMGLADNPFFRDILHPAVNSNTATSLLSADSISEVRILLANAMRFPMGGLQIKTPSISITSLLGILTSWCWFAYSYEEVSSRQQCCTISKFFQEKGGDT
jgi:hypothetical protein